MTIVPAVRLDRNDLRELGDNVTEAIRIDHEAAMNRSLACLDIGPADLDDWDAPGTTEGGADEAA